MHFLIHFGQRAHEYPVTLSERQYPWRFCVSKGWVRNVHPKGESSMVVSGLDV